MKYIFKEMYLKQMDFEKKTLMDIYYSEVNLYDNSVYNNNSL